jgi:hypothetical protein
MKKCLHQIIRPSRKNLARTAGVGECVDCKPDKNNKNCKLYTPINITILEVKKNEEDE